jgi:predicted phage terminase large subunit-like protein
MNFINPSPQQVLDAVMRQDLYSFIRGVFAIVSTNGRFMANWHLEAIAYALEKVVRGETRRLLILLPPRSLKSIITSVALPAYILGHDPTARIICGSYSESLARKHSNDCRILVGSDRYKRLFPQTRISKQKDTETEFQTTRGGFRYATSVGGPLTGRGGNILIIDDPQKPQDAHSEIARQNAKDWYGRTAYSRLDSKTTGAIIVVMQRLHEDDLAGYLMQQEGWEVLSLPAIAEVDEVIPIGHDRSYQRRAGEVLHPEREPLSSLQETKLAMGTMDFAAQYQQAPVPEHGNLIHWPWFQFYDPAQQWSEAGDQIIISCDTAQSSKELSSYSVIMVAMIRGERAYIREVVRQQLEYPALRQKVLEVYRRWKNICGRCSLLIEDTVGGKSLIQELKQEYRIHPIPIQPMGDKVMRMSAQTAKLEAGSVFLPSRAPWLSEFEKEMKAFPRGRTNDQVDALSQLLNYMSDQRARRGGWGTYKGFY